VLVRRPGHRPSLATEMRLTTIFNLVAIICLSMVLPQALLGATPAGTIVSNSASLQHDGGTVSSNTVSVTVALQAAAALSLGSTSQTGAPGTILYYAATLTNQGNGSDAFNIVVTSARGWTKACYLDSNNDGVHQSTETTALSTTSAIAAGAAVKFFAAVTIPAGTAGGTQDTLTVAATSVGDTTVSKSAVCTATVSQSAAVVLSPTSASRTATPGQTLSYPVTLTNSGSGADSFSLTIASAQGWTTKCIRDDNNDGVLQAEETTIVSNTGSLAANGQFRFFGLVTVPSGAAAMQGSLTITARSAVNSSTTAAATYTVTVQTNTQPGVKITPNTASVIKPNKNTVYFPVSITNDGSAADSFNLSIASNQGWPTHIYDDTNQNGVFDAGETTLIGATSALSVGASKRVFAAVDIPGGEAAGTKSTITFRVNSAADPNCNAQGSYYATVQSTITGDIDNDGQVTLTDVNAAAQIAAGATGNWSATQLGMADANGDGVVNIQDVMYLLNVANGVLSQLDQSAGLTLSLPALTAPAGASLPIPVAFDEGTGVAGIQFSVQYDPALLDISAALPGDQMTDPNWQVICNASSGQINIIAYNTTGATLPAGAGNLLNLSAQVADTAPLGVVTPLVCADPLFTDVTGAGNIAVQTTDGSMTITEAGAIAVVVTRHGTTTPIANAHVEALLNGQLVQSATTDALGNCALSGLAPGSYDVLVSAAAYYGEGTADIVVTGSETASLAVGLVAQTKANTGAIEGYVFNTTTGKPIKRAKVQFNLSGRRIAYVYTDANGRYYRIGLAPDENYQVVASLSGYTTQTQTVGIYANVMSKADFQLQPAVITNKRIY
jgi:uncharacterized membrane protein